MTEAIIVAIISGGLALIGTITTCAVTARKTEQNIQVHQAVTETKIEELTREVHKHNNFAERIPVMEEQIKSMNHRIKDLEVDTK